MPYFDSEFFGHLFKEYPLGHNAFFKWLAEFKQRPECIAFSHPIGLQPGDYPSWGQMPGPLQVGIWIEFCMERGGCTWRIPNLFSYDWKQDMTEMFRLMHEELSMSELTDTIVEESIALADIYTAPQTAASTIRTPDEIKRQIYCIMAMKELKRRWNRATIDGFDAQIEILTGAAEVDAYLPDDTAEEFDDSDNEIYFEADAAAQWLHNAKIKTDVFDENDLPEGFKVPELDANRKLIEPLYWGIFGEQSE